MARTKGKVTGTAEDGWAQLTVAPTQLMPFCKSLKCFR